MRRETSGHAIKSEAVTRLGFLEASAEGNAEERFSVTTGQPTRGLGQLVRNACTGPASQAEYYKQHSWQKPSVNMVTRRIILLHFFLVSLWLPWEATSAPPSCPH